MHDDTMGFDPITLAVTATTSLVSGILGAIGRKKQAETAEELAREQAILSRAQEMEVARQVQDEIFLEEMRTKAVQGKSGKTLTYAGVGIAGAVMLYGLYKVIRG